MNELTEKNAALDGKILSLKDGTDGQKDPKKRREIIKTVLIIFLAVLLVLTFFSNTIMNRSLSEISTQSVSSGKLTERIRGSGLVESNQSYEVTVDGNKTVDTIYVKTGQEVEKDDVLFTVGTGESDELTEAEATLESLKLEYQKALLVVPADYSAENQAIKNAQEDLNNAITKRDNAAANQDSDAAAKAQYNQNKISLEQKTSEQTKLQSTIAAIDGDAYDTAAVEYTGDIIPLYNEYISAENEYNTASELYSQLIADGEDASAAADDVNAKAEARDSAKTAYDDAKASLRRNLVDSLSSVESDIASLNTAISDYESNLSSGETMTLDDLNTDVETKQRALEDLVIALEKTKKEDDVNSQIANLDVEAKKAEIDKQQEKVDKLKKECSSTEVKSKYSGVVTSINIKPGEMTVPDTAAVVIDISSEGYRVEITVDGEKSKKIKTGTEAEVVNNWSGDVTAVVSEIKNDTTSGSKNRILVFDVTGSIDSGTSIDLSIPCGSGSYDAIVPKSAVYEDKNGKFVLTVKSKSSPLGNRYYAERVNVEVLASDETNSAVSGDISSGDYVITAASKPVSPGDQVRMKD